MALTSWIRTLRPGSRRGVAAAAAVILGSSLVALATGLAHAAAGCSVQYTANSWNSGFTANLTITNLGDPITDGWQLSWTYGGNQQITQAWNSTSSQSGQAVTLTNAPWNAALGHNASVYPGFLGTYSGSNDAPTSFVLNGVTCTGQVVTPSTSPTTTTAPPTSPTTTPPTTATPTSTTPTATTTTTAPAGTHLDNPYVGAKVYVNPDWSAKAAAEPGGDRISGQPTGVWLDSIASITAPSGSGYGTSLRDHLDNALRAGCNPGPVRDLRPARPGLRRPGVQR